MKTHSAIATKDFQSTGSFRLYISLILVMSTSFCLPRSKCESAAVIRVFMLTFSTCVNPRTLSSYLFSSLIWKYNSSTNYLQKSNKFSCEGPSVCWEKCGTVHGNKWYKNSIGINSPAWVLAMDVVLYFSFSYLERKESSIVFIKNAMQCWWDFISDM